MWPYNGKQYLSMKHFAEVAVIMLPWENGIRKIIASGLRTFFFQRRPSVRRYILLVYCFIYMDCLGIFFFCIILLDTNLGAKAVSQNLYWIERMLIYDPRLVQYNARPGDKGLFDLWMRMDK